MSSQPEDTLSIDQACQVDEIYDRFEDDWSLGQAPTDIASDLRLSLAPVERNLRLIRAIGQDEVS
jgi:hypothetical protein